MPRPRNVREACAKHRPGMTKVDLAATIVVLGILLAILLPTMNSTRGPSRQIDCASMIRQLALACQMYSTKYEDSIPPGIVTVGHHSGFVQLLPYLEGVILSDSYDPLRSADENPVVTVALRILRCPIDQPMGTWQSPGGGTYARSNYVMNFGSGTLDPGNAQTDDGGTLHGPFLLDKAGSYTSMATDGTTNTVMFSEIIAGGYDGRQPDGAWGYGDAGTAAYTHRYPPNAEIDVTVLGEDSPWTEAQATASSRHPGGVNVVFASTAITFVVDDIDAMVWKAYGTANGGEAVVAE